MRQSLSTRTAFWIILLIFVPLFYWTDGWRYSVNFVVAALVCATLLWLNNRSLKLELGTGGWIQAFAIVLPMGLLSKPSYVGGILYGLWMFISSVMASKLSHLLARRFDSWRNHKGDY